MAEWILKQRLIKSSVVKAGSSQTENEFRNVARFFKIGPSLLNLEMEILLYSFAERDICLRWKYFDH